MDREEMEQFVADLIDSESKEMLELTERGGIHGRKAESSEIMGSMAVCGGTDRVSGKNVLQD